MAVDRQKCFENTIRKVLQVYAFLACSTSWSQVEWDTDPGTREVQWVKTYADTGPNEVQSITTTADDVDEIQQLIISANETQEVQVRVGANVFVHYRGDSSCGKEAQHSIHLSP